MFRKITLWTFLLMYSTAEAADKYQITLQVSPSLETMNLRNKYYNGVFGHKLSYNFGVDSKIYLSPEFSLSSGIYFQRKGFRNELDFITSDSSSSFFNKSVLIGIANYIMIPADMNFHKILKRRTSLVFSIGFLQGILINQALLGKRIPPELAGDIIEGLGATYEANQTRHELDIYRKYYLGCTVGLGISKYIKQKAVVVIKPFYSLQLNKATREDAPIHSDLPVRPKLDSFGIDLKIGYYFNKNMNSEKKVFY